MQPAIWIKFRALESVITGNIDACIQHCTWGSMTHGAITGYVRMPSRKSLVSADFWNVRDFQNRCFNQVFSYFWRVNVVLSHNKRIHLNDNTTRKSCPSYFCWGLYITEYLKVVLYRNSFILFFNFNPRPPEAFSVTHAPKKGFLQPSLNFI